MPAAVSSICCTRLTIFPRKNISWKMDDKSSRQPASRTWSQVPCSAPPLLHYYECLWRLDGLSDTPTPTPLPCADRAQHFTVPGPVTALSMDADQPLPPPQCLDPFIHNLRDETIPSWDESEASLAQPTYRAPSTALFERLSTDQRSSFLQTWNRLPLHTREITFDLHSPG